MSKIEVQEACPEWAHVQHIKDPVGVVHDWDVFAEETGELRTACGLVFWDGGRSADWQDTQEPASCPTCDRHEEKRDSAGRS